MSLTGVTVPEFLIFFRSSMSLIEEEEEDGEVVAGEMKARGYK